jgi:hypothetical protein
MIFRMQFLRTLAIALCIAVTASTTVVAQSHVVNGAELQKQLVAASKARQHNLETVRDFVTSERAQKAMKSAGIDATQVKTAISTLDSEELAQLAAQAEKAQADFAAGNLSDRDLILIILGIVALVLIIVAVR